MPKDSPVLGLKQSERAVAFTTQKRLSALEKEVADLKKIVSTFVRQGAK
jgi:hypothetical protein